MHPFRCTKVFGQFKNPAFKEIIWDKSLHKKKIYNHFLDSKLHYQRGIQTAFGVYCNGFFISVFLSLISSCFFCSFKGVC